MSTDWQGGGTDDPDRLRELVDEWREYARMGAEPGKTETFIARAQTYGKCADELEEAIENGEVTA